MKQHKKNHNKHTLRRILLPILLHVTSIGHYITVDIPVDSTTSAIPLPMFMVLPILQILLLTPIPIQIPIGTPVPVDLPIAPIHLNIGTLVLVQLLRTAGHAPPVRHVPVQIQRLAVPVAVGVVVPVGSVVLTVQQQILAVPVLDRVVIRGSTSQISEVMVISVMLSIDHRLS